VDEKVYHLSHIDLDGYSCQLISKRCFKDIAYFNSNYGQEIRERLEQIFAMIESDRAKSSLILITDLNLSMEDCRFLEERVAEFDTDVTIRLLDHHKTGFECFESFEWYYLDSSRSATKITYDFFLEKGYDIEDLREYVEVVNAIDIWLSDSEYFELGKVFMRLVSDAKEINRMLFSDKNIEYIFFMLTEAMEYMELENPQIVLDNDLHILKKRFFFDKSDDTLDNLVSNFIVKELTKRADELTINYNGYKGILTYGIGNTSVIGNEFLVKNGDFDFFMDINGRGNISLRANGKMDVSLMAKTLFGGGGHANAAGAKFENFKDSFIYENIKEQIQEALTIGENHG
jgi:oligoribonuclease NrnB/cAMP/cGMP phosphodiesterase (DHH superfamily)